MSSLQDAEKLSLRSVLAVIALAALAQEWSAEGSKMILLLHLHLLKGAAKAALYCAHRTSTFLSCTFCEQEGHLVAPSPAGGLFQHPDSFARSAARQRYQAAAVR
jgi:hypothetical protein